jgi:GNAT superfamily N-acetyltransferase
VILQRRIEQGTAVYLLTDAGGPVGIVSVFDDLIADLYVLPEKQGKGYGTVLLQFAVEHCRGMPVLWILSSNTAARRLYERYGFRLTGNKKPLRSDLAELEMVLDQCAHKKLHLAGAGKTCQIL